MEGSPARHLHYALYAQNEEANSPLKSRLIPKAVEKDQMTETERKAIQDAIQYKKRQDVKKAL